MGQDQMLKEIRADLKAVMHAQASMLNLMRKCTLHFSDLPSQKEEVKK